MQEVLAVRYCEGGGLRWRENFRDLKGQADIALNSFKPGQERA